MKDFQLFFYSVEREITEILQSCIFFPNSSNTSHVFETLGKKMESKGFLMTLVCPKEQRSDTHPTPDYKVEAFG